MEAATQAHIAELPAIPAALRSALGPDGVQALWTHVVETFAYPSTPDACVWTEALPTLTRQVLAKASRDQAKQEWDLESAQLAVQDADGRAEAAWQRSFGHAKELGEVEEAHEAEVARLQAQLREARMHLHHARGREEALQGVIAQWMSAQGVERRQQGGLGP